MSKVVACVGAVITDDQGRLLLIRRGTEPSRGLWSIPGGRCEPGESATAAVTREVLEETGLVVRAGAALGRVERSWPGDLVYDIEDFICTPLGGRLRAGDDASDARWVDPDELARLPLIPGLVEALTEWAVLPLGQPRGTGRPGCSPPLDSP